MRNKMDLSVSIAVGSAAQVGLFLAPIVVLVSFLIGPSPMALVLNGWELAALVLAALLAGLTTYAGRSTWRSGAALLGLYGSLAVVSALA
jgi:Ca2+:H+ antiporter